MLGNHIYVNIFLIYCATTFVNSSCDIKYIQKYSKLRIKSVVKGLSYSLRVRPVPRPYIGEAAEVVTKATTELTLPMVKTSNLGFVSIRYMQICR